MPSRFGIENRRAPRNNNMTCAYRSYRSRQLPPYGPTSLQLRIPLARISSIMFRIRVFNRSYERIWFSSFFFFLSRYFYLILIRLITFYFIYPSLVTFFFLFHFAHANRINYFNEIFSNNIRSLTVINRCLRTSF